LLPGRNNLEFVPRDHLIDGIELIDFSIPSFGANLLRIVTRILLRKYFSILLVDLEIASSKLFGISV